MDLIGDWHALLRPDEELTPKFTAAFAASMRAKKLTFGQRIHCPFLRPFFLTAADEARIRGAAETIVVLGERVARAALENDDIYHQLGMTEPEDALVDIEPGYATASTTSRLDAFLLPESLHFAEYNAESPAGIGYTQRLCELFDASAAMGRFRDTRQVRFHKPIDTLLAALLASYREWGGTAQPPTMAIVDWRDVPTWTEFEILRDAFVAAGVPTIVCDPRELVFANGALTAQGSRIDLVYRRVLVNDILARPDECRALVRRTRGVHGELVPLQAGAQEGVLRRPHRPGAHLALLRGRARRDPRPHPVDTGTRRRRDRQGRLARRSARPRPRVARASGAQAE
jgi:hypothetical protein